MFRKTPETFYIRNDRHSGASMAIRDSDSDHDNYSYYVRADNSSSTSSVRPVPVDQIQDRRDGYDQSVQRRYYPATHRLRTVEYREDDATTTHFYPPSEFSGTEIRNSFKFVDRNREFRPNDSPWAQSRQPPQTRFTRANIDDIIYVSTQLVIPLLQNVWWFLYLKSRWIQAQYRRKSIGWMNIYRISASLVAVR